MKTEIYKLISLQNFLIVPNYKASIFFLTNLSLSQILQKTKDDDPFEVLAKIEPPEIQDNEDPDITMDYIKVNIMRGPRKE